MPENPDYLGQKTWNKIKDQMKLSAGGTCSKASIDINQDQYTHFKQIKEAKRNFATHSDLWVDIKHVDRHLKTWSEMWVPDLELLHQLSIKFLKKQAH